MLHAGFPHDFIPALTLLGPPFNYPFPSPDILTKPAEFSYTLPDTSSHPLVKALKGRSTMPHGLVIRRLKINLGQAWFDGGTSIIDIHYADFLLPF